MSNTLAAYEFLNQATSDLARIDELASPGCNFALATGDDLFAIKLDGGVGAASFSELASKELGGNEEDWGIKTLLVRGQAIIYALFKSPEKGLHLRSNDRRFAPGLAIRGSGDWIPLPPSRFSGVKYFYEDPEASVAVAPKFLANLVFLPDGEAEDVLPIRFPPRRAEPEYFPASGKRGAGAEPRNAVRNGAPMYGGGGWQKRFQISRRC